MRTLIVFIIVLFSVSVWAGDWNSSPSNWENNPSNYENSPNNYRNSPNNYRNSPTRYGNPRIIRDNEGEAVGYVVPKQDGGANLFNFKGERQGYVPRGGYHEKHRRSD